MYIKSKKFKRLVYIVLTVLLSIGLVIPLAALFQRPPVDPQSQTAQTGYERIDELEELLLSEPNDVDAICELGELYDSVGNRERATDMFERALARDSAREEALYYVARSNYGKGENDLAIEQLETIVANNPEHGGAYLLISYIYAIGEKDYEAGIQAMENYIAVAGPNENTDVARQTIVEWQKIVDGE